MYDAVSILHAHVLTKHPATVLTDCIYSLAGGWARIIERL